MRNKICIPYQQINSISGMMKILGPLDIVVQDHAKHGQIIEFRSAKNDGSPEFARDMNLAKGTMDEEIQKKLVEEGILTADHADPAWVKAARQAADNLNKVKPKPIQFKRRFEGKVYSCSYEVSAGSHPIITVVTPWGSKSTQLGNLPELTLAKQLSGELARASRLKA